VPGFIIDWSQGLVAEPPKGLRRYEVSFHTKLLNEERLVYVVSYEFDSSTQLGYVYLPGKTNENLRAERGYDLPWSGRKLVSSLEYLGQSRNVAHCIALISSHSLKEKLA
jgi:hypothetical protein